MCTYKFIYALKWVTWEVGDRQWHLRTCYLMEIGHFWAHICNNWPMGINIQTVSCSLFLLWLLINRNLVRVFGEHLLTNCLEMSDFKGDQFPFGYHRIMCRLIHVIRGLGFNKSYYYWLSIFLSLIFHLLIISYFPSWFPAFVVLKLSFGIKVELEFVPTNSILDFIS